MSGNATYQELGDLKVAFYWDDEFGEQRPALICGDLALTSTRSRDGTVTSEVAKRLAPSSFSNYKIVKKMLVGAVGIEPTTFGLKGRCSTTELRP